MISVIIPVYNTEKYLDKCIESVVNQTYSNLEILLIDDCSTDGSPEILDRWSEIDNRIKVIHKSDNSGVSDTRNIGLKCASGEYIAFVDSDDWLEPNMYFELYYWLDKTDADIAFGGYKRIRNDRTILVVPKEESGSILSVDKALLHCIPQRGAGRYDLFIWNKLFRKSAITYNNELILFDTRYSYCEDVLWLIQVILNCNFITCWNECGYNYQAERNGNTWTAINKYNNLKYCDSALASNTKVLQLLQEKKSVAENNALQRVLYSQKYALRTAANIGDRAAYEKYSDRYVHGLLLFLMRNRTIIGMKWTGKQMLSHALFILKILFNFKSVKYEQ